MPRLYADVEGLPKLLEKLTPRFLYWQILKAQLDELGRGAAGSARSSASTFRRTGDLAGGIEHKVNSIPKPLWVAVTTDATSKSGRRYPWILEFGAKWGHKNWLRDAVRRVQGGAARLTDAAARQIEGRWGS